MGLRNCAITLEILVATLLKGRIFPHVPKPHVITHVSELLLLAQGQVGFVQMATRQRMFAYAFQHRSAEPIADG
jgi:hypothetical protein